MISGSHSAKAIKKEEMKAYRELSERMKREQEMKSIGQKLQLQRNLMGKGVRKKISKKEGAPLYKWKRVRSK